MTSLRRLHVARLLTVTIGHHNHHQQQHLLGHGQEVSILGTILRIDVHMPRRLQTETCLRHRWAARWVDFQRTASRTTLGTMTIAAMAEWLYADWQRLRRTRALAPTREVAMMTGTKAVEPPRGHRAVVIGEDAVGEEAVVDLLQDRRDPMCNQQHKVMDAVEIEICSVCLAQHRNYVAFGRVMSRALVGRCRVGVPSGERSFTSTERIKRTPLFSSKRAEQCLCCFCNVLDLPDSPQPQCDTWECYTSVCSGHSSDFAEHSRLAEFV